MSDKILLEKIIKELDAKDKLFVKTEITSILPRGLFGYSLNVHGYINGIKIGGLNKNISKILNILKKIKYLERLVLYSDHPFALPDEIMRNKNLKYISLSGAERLPQNMFENNLPLFISSNIESKERSQTKQAIKIEESIYKFKLDNPTVKFDYKYDYGKISIINHPTSENYYGIDEELRLLCLTKKSKDNIANMTGIFLDSSYTAIVDPPFEIVHQGSEAIKQYFFEKNRQGVDKLFEAKIVIVGAGESGKTTLIKKLHNPLHEVPNLEDKRTEGIRVSTYSFPAKVENANRELHAHIWDFGGQELYYTTHQLFLTADTLYILLNDNRKNDTDFYYWLNIVTLRAGNSPILMVFNAKNGASRQIIPGAEIFKTFPNLIKDAIDINFADADSFEIGKMKLSIESCFTKLDVLGKPFPAYWVKVREELTKIDEEHISFRKFIEICKKSGVIDIPQIKLLANTLHNLGTLLYFPDIFGLENLIILKSQWCIDAIYSALDTKDIVDNGGRFNEQTLAEKWKDIRFSENHLQLLKLMQHFDLCYKIEGTNDFIAPQLLPIQEIKLNDLSKKWSIIFHFDYIFMPAGLITRLISRFSIHIKQPYAWRTGVVFEWEDKTIALVEENQLRRRIIIKINGPSRKRRLLEIRKCLYDLQRDFKGIRFDELIMCNCKDCLEGGNQTMFNIKELEDDAAYDDDVTCRNNTRKKIPAKTILEGTEYIESPRVFISYSHKNENFKNEFRIMLSPLEKERHWKIWDDQWLLPGDNWNKEILRHINEANIIILMLTADFFNSNFIYDIELGRAIQRHEAGDALIIGIVVSDCLWEETPLSKIQILPRDAVPVDRHLHRSEIWKQVASKIKETIAVRQDSINRVGGWDS